MNRKRLISKAKPITFDTKMVKAVLAGRKTTTRQICNIKADGGIKILHKQCETYDYSQENAKGTYVDFFDENNYYKGTAKLGYRPGDVLYIRETWNYGYFNKLDVELYKDEWFEPVPLDYDGTMKPYCQYVYKADYTEEEQANMGIEHKDGSFKMDWQISTRMPKDAARIFLKVTDVRIEQLQDITPSENLKEGIRLRLANILNGESALETFAQYWDSTMDPKKRKLYGWKANPWVWVITFEKIEV